MTVQEVQERLSEIVGRLKPGDQIEITENGLPVAILFSAAKAKGKKLRQLGTMKGSVIFMAPDFDDPLEDFKKHME